MGILDYFKRTGKPITSETIEAKIGEVVATISTKESEIARMREELSAKVLEGDHLGAHRIEHEEHEIKALKIAKDELESKLGDVRESELIAKLEAKCDVAEEKRRKCEAAADAFIEAFKTVIAPAEALFKAHADFVAADFDGTIGRWDAERNIAESFCDLVACETYLRVDGVPATPRVKELLNPYQQHTQPRATIDSFMVRLRTCVEVMREQVQDRRECGKARSGSKAA